MSESPISVVGLGKLGIPFAAAAASKGSTVIGVEQDKARVDIINAGKAPVFEPGLEEMMKANRQRLRATTDYRDAVLNSSITFVIVPTPSDERGAFTLKYINQAMVEIGKALKEKKGYHLVVITSTVLPGSTEHSILPTLEKTSGKKCGKDFGLCYSPEFIALGSVIHDLLNPDFILIGQSDEKAGKDLEAWYRSFCGSKPPITRMNWVNAELTKISINSYITTKITFANTLAKLCEQLPGGDIDAVTQAVGLDSRIGKRYLTGALGYGGPCFPRDNRALAFIAESVGASVPLANTTDETNRSMIVDQTLEIVGAMAPGATVAVVGLSYKPDTNVIDESPGIALAKSLLEKGNPVLYFDPLAMSNAKSALGAKAKAAASVADCLKTADAIVFMNPDKEVRALKSEDFPRRKTPVLVVDCWRQLKTTLQDCEWVRYFPLGIGQQDKAKSQRLEKLWASHEDQTNRSHSASAKTRAVTRT